MKRTRAATPAGVLASALLVSGCQGAYDLPLPGGAAGGDDVYRVAIEFSDVLDLVPQSAVKVNDVTVGAVESVELDGWAALVTVRLEDHVALPDNATAELRQTSLLGEKFVSLEVPEDGAAVGRLSDGDLIPLARTGRNPEVEEVLGALSLLLNGGGVAQLQTINRELNDALEGRESDVRGVLQELDTFVGGLEAQKSEIVRALDELDRLAATLEAQRGDISFTLEQMPAGLETLEASRAQLTEMLTALSELGTVATRVIDASQADTVANLEALAPVLTRLNEAGEALPASLELLFTYPFTDSSMNAMRGDYANLDITLDADLRSLEHELPDDGPAPPRPAPPAAPSLPSLPDACALLPDGTLPTGCGPVPVPVVPGLPTTCPTVLLPGASLPVECRPAPGPGGAGTGSGGGGSGDGGLADLLLGGVG